MIGFRVYTLAILVMAILLSSIANAFNSAQVFNHGYRTRLQAGNTEGGTAIVDEIRSMRVKQIKEELSKLNVSTQDVFEKEELVQRLLKARKRPSKASPSSSQAKTSQPTTGTLEVPLYLTSLEAGARIAAVDGAAISIETADHPYPSIQIIALPSNGKEFKLNLLLDTACSGLVLRPNVVQRHNLPSLSTPVTMTGAGGVATTPKLSQLDKFRLGDRTFGPLPAAVQDIGALPSSLDGIIGLSFLHQFSGVDMDFRNGKLLLYPKGPALPDIPIDLEVVAEGEMSLVPSLDIYVVDVLLGNRGPVKMLVDSGASDTFLNWKGVANLGLSRDSKFLNRLPDPMGAMGSDAVAMELTHRISISSNLNLGKTQRPGLPLQGSRRLSIDIGNISILETLDGVGGILGINAFMRNDFVRLIFDGKREIKFLVSNDEANGAASGTSA